MSLLFLNSLKGLKHHKLQMFSIVILILLSTGIYTMMKTALDRIEDRYYSYLVDQNVEDFSFITNISYEEDFTVIEVENYLNKELKYAVKEDKNDVLLYLKCLENKTNICDTYLYTKIDSIFQNYGIKLKKDVEKINGLSTKYDFSYATTSSKTYMANGITTKIIPFNKDATINIPYLLEGRFPKKDNEITILKAFALKHSLNIGDTYELNNKNYVIVGFAYASDYIYPILSINCPFFDKNKNNIIFMTNTGYKNFKAVEETIYSAKFNYEIDPKSRMEIELELDNNNLVAKTNNPASKFFVAEQKNVTRNISTILRTIRIDTMQLELQNIKIFSNSFLYLLLFISSIVILIIIKKRIETEKLQIGVLKALGYNRIKIAVSYLVYPVIGSFIGGLLGYLLGYFANGILTNIYLSYFNIVLKNISINYIYLFQCIFISLISLSLLSLTVSLFLLRKKTLDLLREGSNLKINFLTKFINKITRKMDFIKKFKLSLASRFLSKFFVIFSTSFITGLLIVLCLISSNLFSNLINKSFDNYKFNYMIFYNQVLEVFEEDDDCILQVSIKFKAITNKNNELKNKVKNSDITIYGIASSLKYVDILEKKNKNLINYLTDQTIIINSNVSKLYNISLGDYVVFSINEIDYSFEVVGIENSYLNEIAYVKISDLSKILGFNYDIYNLKYSNSLKYSNISNLSSSEISAISVVFSISELKENIFSQLRFYNDSLYILIFFAALIALIIILVIVNIIIEENKKIISLMKVMGYENKIISKIVLNIYTPLIIISYFLSIPIMKKILEKTVAIFSKDIGMVIPINITINQILLGLIVLLLVYFIALRISKNLLDKIPLSIALKRE